MHCISLKISYIADELSNNSEWFCGVDGHAGAKEGSISHTVGVEVTSVGVGGAAVSVGGVCASAGIPGAHCLRDRIGSVRSQGS